MLKNTVSLQYELEIVSLEQLVPKAIDFEFIRDEVAHLYCHDGNPAIAPGRQDNNGSIAQYPRRLSYL